ncbi:hypothetical protein RQP46_005396 [Phenoliferia psychrophenolica]
MMSEKVDKELTSAKVSPATSIVDEKADRSASEDGLPVVGNITLEEAKEIIHAAIDGKELDPMFPVALLKRAREALRAEELSHDVARGLVEELQLEAALFDDSPYLEVRAVVDGTDDVTMPVNTFRSWVIGMLFVTLGTGINVFFYARFPLIQVNTYCAQVVAYPIGKLMEYTLPTKKFKTFGHEWSLNPGPFNMKEHMLATVMANVTFGGGIGVYTTDVIFVLRLPVFFNQTVLGAGFQILITLSTQLLGFGIAGLTRRFLVYPPAMIWPVNLATIALNKSFHATTNPVANGWRISRLKMFLYVFIAYSLYFVFPDAVFQALQYFNWTTWINPTSVTLALVTGSVSGLGINPFTTFDYNNLLIDPIITPLFATLNVFAGMVFIGLPFICIVYWKNLWFSGYLPIVSSTLFDNTGSPYNVSRVMGPDYKLDVAGYEGYSAPYQTAGNALEFFAFFAVYTATLVHIGLYHRTEIMNGFRAVIRRENPRDAYNDVHNRLMRAYKEVPEWWYLTILVISVVFGIVANEVYETQLPVWAIFLCLVLALVFTIPCGIITAITNLEVTINVISELIAGYALPGRPIANMLFKSYGVVSAAQAIGYAGDLKLGHYVKIPPRTMFTAQLIASVWSCFVALGVADWQITNIPELCTPHQLNKFNCAASYNIFFNSAVQWGVIGPARLYSIGRIYQNLMYGFLFGALLPVVLYVIAKKYPTSFMRYASAPILFYGCLLWSPTNLSYVTPGVYIALFFHVYLRRVATDWWAKYALIIATGFKSAIGLAGVIWFFAILYNGYEPANWWGNTVSFSGCDGMGCPRLPLPDIGFFGPKLAPL